MEIRAALTVVGDGPVGAIGRQIDDHFGMPKGAERNDWAVGMKMVVDLPENTTLEPGTVIHTLAILNPKFLDFYMSTRIE
jgi:electron-transferring-flavoprotein dehydrogenase